MLYDTTSDSFTNFYQIDTGYELFSAVVSGNFVYMVGKQGNYAFTGRTLTATVSTECIMFANTII
jgi:hypothetical protein